MAYSRWSNSSWYSFWDCCYGQSKENQILSLWLGQARNNLDFSYDDLYEFSSEDFKYHYSNITEEEIAEGLAIIKTFLEDVDENFYEI